MRRGTRVAPWVTAAALALFPPQARAEGTPAPGAPAKPARPPPPSAADAGRFFDMYDADRDGVVTRAEFLGLHGAPDVFALLDLDKDGRVTPDEMGLPAAYRPRPLPRLAADPPVGLTRPEAPPPYLERVQRQIHEMDTETAGTVTR